MRNLSYRLASVPASVWLAVALLGTALALRLGALDQFPPGVQHDEVFIANFAETILQGHYPIFFELNRGNEPLFMYLTAGMFKLFGTSVWSLRAAAALCGSGALLLTWLLVRDLFNGVDLHGSPTKGAFSRGDRIALVATVGITFSFWHLYESRIGLHSISTYLMAAATFYAFWLGWTRERTWLLILSGIFAGLAAYTYRSGIFVSFTLLLFVVYTLLFHRGRWGNRIWLAPFIFVLAALVYVPLGYFIATHPDVALARVGDLSGDMDALRHGNLVPMLTNLVRVLGMFGISGDPEWRYNVAGRPIFDPLWAILFYGGVLIALWRAKRAPYAFALVWLGGMLLPSILSGSDLSQHRAVGAIGAAFIFPALLLDDLWLLAKARWGRAGQLAGVGAILCLCALAAAGGLYAYFVTWTNSPAVRLIQRSDLATAARWLDVHQTDERALVSAEFANDLDRGSFNLEALKPNRAQFFHGADTFVLPANVDAYIVNTRSGPIDQVFKQKFLAGAPIYESRLTDGTAEVQIYRLTAQDLARWRSGGGTIPAAQTQDGQLKVLNAITPLDRRTGETLPLEMWWKIGAPQLGDADGLAWVASLMDQSNYVWDAESSLGYTPSQWQSDDIVVTRFLLAIPVDAPPDVYLNSLALASKDGAIPLQGLHAPPAPEIELGKQSIARGSVPATKPDLPIRYPSKAKFGDIQLLGSDAAGDVEAGGTWRLILFWQAGAKIPSNYKLRLTLTLPDGQEIARQEETLLKNTWPTRQWRPGDYIRSIHDLEIPKDAPRGKAVVRVSLWTPENKPVGRADGAPIAGIEIGGRAHTFSELKPQVPERAQFGDAIEMIGYDLPKTTVRPGEALNLNLYWHALKPADRSLTVFVHLLDAQGKVIGQSDSVPLGATAPTDTWLVNEYLADPYTFIVNGDALAGTASLEVGFYDATSGQRLPVTDEHRQVMGDHLVIGGLTVSPR